MSEQCFIDCSYLANSVMRQGSRGQCISFFCLVSYLAKMYICFLGSGELHYTLFFKVTVRRSATSILNASWGCVLLVMCFL